MNSTPPRRLGSIDALRGITVAAMLLVNNPGDWSAVFAPLRHSEWHGCTPTDLVFPFFLFLVGMSMAFSVAPRALDAAARPALARGVLERALRILLAGALLHLLIWWALHTHHFRIWGVLQRIAVCAALVGVLAVYARPRVQAGVLVTLLVGYTVLLLGIGDLAPWTNPASRLDTTLFAPWIYQWHADTGLGHDPEGLLSTVPAIGTALLGMFTGEFLLSDYLREKPLKRVLYMVLAAILLMVIGKVWNIFFPINKNLWTSSFVCFVGGLSLLLFSVFYLIIDVWNYRKWAFFFVVIGLNPITIYLTERIVNFRSATKFFFGGIESFLPDKWAQLVDAIGVVTIAWMFLYFLYKKKIFLKV